MEGEFFELAQRIAGMASEGGLAVSQLGDVVGSQYGEINCYPGEPTGECHSLAVFIALHGRLAKKRWPLDFESMLRKFVQHMQGGCSEVTRHAVIITDSWWAPNFEQWANNVRTISRSARVEIYLIGDPGWTERVYL